VHASLALSILLEQIMKIKKTVTERVLVANLANSGRSTGPDDTKDTRYNATKHTFLEKKIAFADDAEKKEVEALLSQLVRHHDPSGPTERSLVSEMAISLWRLRNLYGWESVEISSRKAVAAAVLKALSESRNAHDLLPLLDEMGQGWEPTGLTVRNGTRECRGEQTDKTGHSFLEARMGSSLDLILRYGAGIRRDFYRALATLRDLQRERLELDQLQPAAEGSDE
jgi:hypothetical protein